MKWIILQVTAAVLVMGVSLAGIHAARAWGQRIHPAETFLDPGDCAMPCWNQLQPGTHPTDLFWIVLEDVRTEGGWMYSGQPTSFDGATISQFKLIVQPSNQIRLGDVLFQYGEPEFAQVKHSASLGRTPGARRPIIDIYLYWTDGAVMVIATQPPDQTEFRITPEMWVREVSMRDPLDEPLYEPGVLPWQGFTSYAFYLID